MKTVEEQLAEALADNEAMKAELATAQAAAINGSDLKIKVSQSGGVSVYGLGRFPVTLYKEQWLRLMRQAARIVQFIKDHEGELRSKADNNYVPKDYSNKVA